MNPAPATVPRHELNLWVVAAWVLGLLVVILVVAELVYSLTETIPERLDSIPSPPS